MQETAGREHEDGDHVLERSDGNLIQTFVSWHQNEYFGR
jgi:hypothetical protein